MERRRDVRATGGNSIPLPDLVIVMVSVCTMKRTDSSSVDQTDGGESVEKKEKLES